jgi:hypothetical protein
MHLHLNVKFWLLNIDVAVHLAGAVLCRHYNAEQHRKYKNGASSFVNKQVMTCCRQDRYLA